MDQIKIGTFIQTLRKECSLTQKELAEQLGITDRAISKWENGRGLPEVSLMKPLCDVLGITVSELLNGERIAQQDYREKSEFRFLDTIEFTDRKIKQKNILLRVIAAAVCLLLLAGIVLIYWIPVTRGYFREDEDIEIFSVVKTLPVAEYGEPLERYSFTDFVEQEITERIDLELLEDLLPLMQVTLYKEDYNTSGFWQGDYIYQIRGYFKTGSREGQAFWVMIGDFGRNYLMPHKGTGVRIHTISQHDTWLRIMEMLEGWDGEYRENFVWETEYEFSVFYRGMLYSNQGELMDLPVDAQRVGSIQRISSAPDEDWECSFGTSGQGLYCWSDNGQTYLAVQVAYDKAYGIPVSID